ncbi:hypothetical protein QBZ16_004485 [Prototheca wickerhamii]|uniref:Coatomer subunit delta n=1 Tax=Prototheca wickerhamii TaxID=3111 RepID=A0AAD9MGW9_PROWI|nr:hypothetical protein QBZ16_004485 [Prototheca wickerhamii]
MVVLAASIVTKSGKALVSRQFLDMTRIRIEGLLAAFPKLVKQGKQHTYVETDNVRYLYQPLESMYLVLVTNKGSNILEDLETLRLCGKVVPEYVHALEEEAVSEAAFSLLFAFDEIICEGYKENVTVGQVVQNTEMESHEEKLHKMIIASKIAETREAMQRKAGEIDKRKLEARAGAGARPARAARAWARAAPGDRGPRGRRPRAALPPAALAAPVFISVDERLSAVLSKDGGLQSMEVQGTMSLTVGEEAAARLRVTLGGASAAQPGFQFKTHPNIDKALYADGGVLALKVPDRPFPVGAPLGVLKWRFQTDDESLAPLSINCWPSVSGGQSYVNIEYQAQAPFDLHGVEIAIPVPGGQGAPQINQIDGDWRFDQRRSQLIWTIELIDASNANGALEFVTPAADAGAYFPVEVSFTAKKTFCNISVEGVESVLDGSPIKYAAQALLATEEYVVE